ncbi:DNA-binding PadR family transcriptional regulator [Trueperella bonasi]|uniref:DNA-binding PadR family transcriptional regulator n=1 Tax=Trueperella bonasi TaxID=312286 RepID=A0ABT9NHC3_9ACTO|nr:helix-turn-helix transcriptional regulator [Trueperella bonasi]MDP9806782.1 DNA-binding PadR family transcriptional regulator [Trueperella bonasi]
MADPQYAFLGLLSKEPNHGYQLKKLYDHYFAGDKPMLAGQVYSILARLARDAMIFEIADSGESGGPSRTRYALTELGARELDEWLATPEPPAPTLQADLYVKTILALLVNGEAATFLQAQRKAHMQRMRELTARKKGASVADKVLLDYSLFHIEADLRWIDMTASRLNHLKEQL